MAAPFLQATNQILGDLAGAFHNAASFVTTAFGAPPTESCHNTGNFLGRCRMNDQIKTKSSYLSRAVSEQVETPDSNRCLKRELAQPRGGLYDYAIRR